MATQLFLIDGDSTTDWAMVGTGLQDVGPDGVATNWLAGAFRAVTSRGTTLDSLQSNTVAGPTGGVPVKGLSDPLRWQSLPLAADITISGTMTFNLWASEGTMSANVAINCQVWRLACATNTLSQIVKTARVTEVAIGTSAVNNFTATPTSTAMKKGDRLIFVVFADDAGTMGGSDTWTFYWSSPTAAVSGDSYVSLTETLSFLSEPAGTEFMMSEIDISNDVGGSNLRLLAKREWELTTVDAITFNTTVTASYHAPIQITMVAGGTTCDWFSPPLRAFTLSGAVGFGLSSFDARGQAAMLQVDVVNSAGTVISAFGATVAGYSMAAVTGPDTAVADGQRLRFRVFADDPASGQGLSGTMSFPVKNQIQGEPTPLQRFRLTQTVYDYVPQKSSPYPQTLPQ